MKALLITMALTLGACGGHHEPRQVIDHGTRSVEQLRAVCRVVLKPEQELGGCKWCVLALQGVELALNWFGSRDPQK